MFENLHDHVNEYAFDYFSEARDCRAKNAVNEYVFSVKNVLYAVAQPTYVKKDNSRNIIRELSYDYGLWS
jgi:hypothetical protein